MTKVLTDKGCSIEGCIRAGYSLGYCNAHYQRFRKGLDMDVPIKRLYKTDKCSVEGCDLAYVALGKCRKHYQNRWVSPTPCSVAGCVNPHQRQGYCQRHFMVVQNYGEEYISLSISIDNDEELCHMNCGRLARSIDHDHTTGIVRGALCTNCNRGLGLLGDNIESLERALSYLRGKL